MTLRYIENELPLIAKTILANVSNKTICFYAPMGAGKTTLIKAMVNQLGAIDAGNSPTFGIVNEYLSPNGETLAYHFDFYRLNNELEALDLGFEEYLDQDVWVFIEWPEKVTSFLPEEAAEIRIEFIDKDTRMLTL